MPYQVKDVRTFIGAKNFDESRTFYRALGYEELIIDPKMSLFRVNEQFGFYLQDYYVKDWVDNSMIFLEVDDVELTLSELKSKNLQQQYKRVKFTEIKEYDWGKEFFMHDPSGVLWHFGKFYK